MGVPPLLQLLVTRARAAPRGACFHIPSVTAQTKKAKSKPQKCPLKVLLVTQEHKCGFRFLGKISFASFESGDPGSGDSVPI